MRWAMPFRKRLRSIQYSRKEVVHVHKKPRLFCNLAYKLQITDVHHTYVLLMFSCYLVYQRFEARNWLK